MSHDPLYEKLKFKRHVRKPTVRGTFTHTEQTIAKQLYERGNSYVAISLELNRTSGDVKRYMERNGMSVETRKLNTTRANT